MQRDHTSQIVSGRFLNQVEGSDIIQVQHVRLVREMIIVVK